MQNLVNSKVMESTNEPIDGENSKENKNERKSSDTTTDNGNQDTSNNMENGFGKCNYNYDDGDDEPPEERAVNLKKR